MCSFIAFAKDGNDHPDPKLDWTKFKLGDVIDGRDDDEFFWGHEINGKNPTGLLRVMVIPGMPWAQMSFLLDADPEVSFQESKPRRLRVNKVDLSALVQKGEVNAGKPLALAEPAVVTRQDVVATVTVKPLPVGALEDVL